MHILIIYALRGITLYTTTTTTPTLSCADWAITMHDDLRERKCDEEANKDNYVLLMGPRDRLTRMKRDGKG